MLQVLLTPGICLATNHEIGTDSTKAPIAANRIGCDVDCISIVSTAITATPIKVVAMTGNKIAATFNIVGPFYASIGKAYGKIKAADN
ncbi:hypothetical protein EH31_15095 [Erythrobacter longus]|uniref:Uncharacterized protein n=1 Tax=Erythrobacter longus TaxID=1044 RepID=A0A074M2R8_ERYLO|nr:hypothetical protein EH31_15095 [Erythrobacter longus]